jgi:hypothetical protein
MAECHRRAAEPNAIVAMRLDLDDGIEPARVDQRQTAR